MGSEPHQLHLIMIPFLAPGHLIPMADMAKKLAEQGVMITLITTPVSAARMKPVIDRAIAKSNLKIQLVQVPLPLHEFGLPEGCDSVDLVPSRNLLRSFFAALRELQKPIEQVVSELKPSPKCIIADKHLAWTAEIASKFRIPRVLFDGMSCFSLLCTHIIRKTQVHTSVPISIPFVVPGMPDHIEFTRNQLPADLYPNSEDDQDFHNKVREAEEGAYGFLVNSFEELESKYIEGYQKEKVSKTWCIGPVSLFNKTDFEVARRGNNMAATDEKQFTKWLDSWPKSSVVYACLGSVNRLLIPQMIELGLGLETSNRPFIWVVNVNDQQEEIENWILDSGFKERTKSRALLIYGWAPQVLILSHPSVGGFLTHCGWNSTLEGITCGKPMITWPMFAEQFYNQKLIVQILKVGESVGVKFVVQYGQEEKFGVLVFRKDIEEAIDKVMREGIEGEDRRERAERLGDTAKKAIEEGGSSYLNMKLFIEDIRKMDMS
ncbi:UDP-glycosyltransferase 73C4-like [Humulus lupulus]|uniref:UDP-glycosyltransferase 73C4-like n=1 Tax=Humulus lupulus TaxID=3486 RepID=UPI002B409053|nr:UDP-glycosyltransferase 73C4-like [Humulus lupulus]